MTDEPKLTASEMRAIGLHAYMVAQNRPISVQEMQAVVRVLAEEYPDETTEPVPS